MTVLPVLLAARELREKYQGGKLSVDREPGWLREMSLGGAEAGRGGGRGEVDLSASDDDLRLREGGESRAEFILGVAGGVLRGVAGWSTMEGLGETGSRGVSRCLLERLLREVARSSRDMVKVTEERQETVSVLLPSFECRKLS